MISFTPCPPYTRSNSSRDSLHSRLAGPQSRSERTDGEKNGLLLPGIEPIFLRRSARSLVTTQPTTTQKVTNFLRTAENKRVSKLDRRNQ